jgi:YHS domain-containing protein/thioredoxin-related protein
MFRISGLHRVDLKTMNIPPKNCRLGLPSIFVAVLAAVVAVCSLTVSGFAQGYLSPPPPSLWESDLDAAMARAEREQRPLFLHFFGNDCQPAQQMAVEVFAQPSIASRLNATFVLVRINASENSVLAQKFAVTSIPTDITMKPNGQLVHRRTGGITAERFSDYLEFLQKTIQSERGALPPPSPPAQSHFPPANPVSSPYQQSTPPQSILQPSPQPGMAPQQREVSAPPGTIRDPFAPQSPFAQQPPPAAITGTMSASSGSQNTLRLHVDDTIPPSTAEYVSHPPQVPAHVNATPPPVAAAVPSIVAVMADVPAPAKMTVEVPLALEGFCPVTLCTEERWSTGNPVYCTMYQGHIFRFATAEALATFARNPANYIPVAMGEDIVLMVDRNKRVNGNRKFGAWYQGRVFLFSSQESLSTFSERPDFYTEIALKYEVARREPSVPIVY